MKKASKKKTTSKKAPTGKKLGGVKTKAPKHEEKEAAKTDTWHAVDEETMPGVEVSNNLSEIDEETKEKYKYGVRYGSVEVSYTAKADQDKHVKAMADFAERLTKGLKKENEQLTADLAETRQRLIKYKKIVKKVQRAESASVAEIEKAEADEGEAA